jgi:aspartyl-tRNA(Asn)/glutamyl-tRNA(Gln) amidotransferase subunit C
MSIDKNTVKYVAHLARIDLKDKELEILCEQLKNILDFINKLEKVDIKGVNPTSHILPICDVLREDVPKTSLLIKKTLENAPEKKGSFFSVPKVIE